MHSYVDTLIFRKKKLNQKIFALFLLEFLDLATYIHILYIRMIFILYNLKLW